MPSATTISSPPSPGARGRRCSSTTSFNENEPIVESPEQALDCFFRTQMDAVVIGTTLVERVAAKAPTPPREGS